MQPVRVDEWMYLDLILVNLARSNDNSAQWAPLRFIAKLLCQDKGVGKKCPWAFPWLSSSIVRIEVEALRLSWG